MFITGRVLFLTDGQIDITHTAKTIVLIHLTF